MGIKKSFQIFLIAVLFACPAALKAQQSRPASQRSGSPNTGAEIVIVGIDAQTLYNIGSGSHSDGKEYRGSFPLDRMWYSKLIAQLSKAKARLVAFDMYFSPEWNSPGSQSFARTVKSTPIPVIVGFEEIPRARPYADNVDLRRYALRIPASYSTAPSAPALALPFTDILKAGAFIGCSSTHEDPDGVLRDTLMFIKNDNLVLPSLPLQIFLQEIGSSAADVQLSVSGDNRFMSVRGKRFRLTDDDELRTSFPPHNSAFRFRSFYDVVVTKENYKKGAEAQHDKKMKEWFENKIVIVGFLDASLGDLKKTPAGGSYPGVEAVAAAVKQLLSFFPSTAAKNPVSPPQVHSKNEKPSKPPKNTNINIAVEDMRKIGK